MSTASKASKIAFWAIGIIAALWNAMGCINLVQQFSAAGVSTLLPEYQSFIETRPTYAFIAFGISVIAGLIGAIFFDDASWSGHRIVLGLWAWRIRCNDPGIKRWHPITRLGQRNVDRIGRNLCAIRVTHTRLTNRLHSTCDFGTMKQQWHLSQRVML
ncbi:hypothetical protein N9755_01565 [bacterium]|nr:hypothetical protein [bacterium]